MMLFPPVVNIQPRDLRAGDIITDVHEGERYTLLLLRKITAVRDLPEHVGHSHLTVETVEIYHWSDTNRIEYFTPPSDRPPPCNYTYPAGYLVPVWGATDRIPEPIGSDENGEWF